MHEEIAGIGHHKKAPCGKKCRRDKGADIPFLRGRAQQMGDGALSGTLPEMVVYRTHPAEDYQEQRDAHGYDHAKGHVPAPITRQQQAQRNAQNLCGSECRLYEAHHPAAYFQRKQIGDDRHVDGEKDAAEHAGDHTGCNQKGVAGGDTTKKCAEDKTGVEK